MEVLYCLILKCLKMFEILFVSLFFIFVLISHRNISFWVSFFVQWIGPSKSTSRKYRYVLHDKKKDFLEMFLLVVADTVEKKDYMAWFIYNRWQEGNASPRRYTLPCALTWNLFFLFQSTLFVFFHSVYPRSIGLRRGTQPGPAPDGQPQILLLRHIRLPWLRWSHCAATAFERTNPDQVQR